MSNIAVQPGDVLLISTAEPGPISQIIRALTDSDYSHCMIALGPDKFADSNDVGSKGNEVEVRTHTLAEVLAAVPPSAGNRVDLYRVPYSRWDREPKEVARKLKAEVKRLRGVGAEFSVGVLVALGFWRSISWPRRLGRIVDAWTRQSATRYREALALAIGEGGSTQLTCSEFVYRMLREAGMPPIDVQRIAMPVRDFGVPVYGLTKTPLVDAVLGSLERFFDNNHLGDEQREEVRATFALANRHYGSGDRLDKLSLHDFVVPVDFVAVADRVGTLSASGDWVNR